MIGLSGSHSRRERNVLLVVTSRIPIIAAYVRHAATINSNEDNVTKSLPSPQELPDILAAAKQAAMNAAGKFFQERLGGRDQYACGFAWVDVYGIRKNSKLGQALCAHGFDKSHTKRSLYLWNPAQFPCQNIDTLEQGAMAYAQVLRDAGFAASANSRLD